MNWRWLMVTLAACGTGSNTDDGASDSSGAAGSTSSATDSSSSSSADGGVATTEESSSAGAEVSSTADDTAGTTGEPSSCDCASTEICVEQSTDGCFDPHIPNTSCVPLPAVCEGVQPACDSECGWEICAGPLCSGPGANVCGAASPGFVCGGFTTTCNLFAQDCAEGDKCTSWANDGGDAFTDTKCVPVENDPVAVGDPCTSEGSHVSGVDDCELGAMCLSEDPTATEGICRAACEGNPFDASCADPAMTCVLEGTYFGWCLPA